MKSKTTPEKTSHSVFIYIDKTPPTVLSATPNRPGDYNGWFNHPVGFSFHGSDQTSGIASCGNATYAGPDGGSVSVGGSCRDVAGNVGFGSFPLNYDTTAPRTPSLSASPGNARVSLKWSALSADETAEVTRFGTGNPATVFHGRSAGFVDRGLRNERRYRYVVGVTDRAGNRSQDEVRVVPTASKLLSPARGARVRKPPFLVWKRARHASYYNVQLIKARKVLSRWPRTSSLQLKKRWRYGGRRLRLAPGRYRWYVWPGYGRRSAHRYGHLLGKSTFTVVR